MNYLLALFLVCLGSGALAMLVAAPRKELGAGFFRLIGYFFGSVLLLGAAVGQPGAEGPPGTWNLVLCAAAVLAVVHALALRSGHLGIEAASRSGAVLAGLVGSALLARALLEVPGTAGLAALALTVISSSALLGATAVGMLCGHWYLIDRKLDFWILRRFTKLLGAAVATKGVAIGAGLLALWPAALPEAVGPLTSPSSLPGMLLLARVGLGVGLVAALTYMVWDCVRRESNQSATGLLYVTLAVVLGCEALGLGIAVVSGGVWL